MGIAHHSNYAIWFEVARTDFIKAAGIDKIIEEAQKQYDEFLANKNKQ